MGRFPGNLARATNASRDFGQWYQQCLVLRMQPCSGRSHPCSFPSSAERPQPSWAPRGAGCSGWEETCSALPWPHGTRHPHSLHPLCHSPSFYSCPNDNSGLIRGFCLVGQKQPHVSDAGLTTEIELHYQADANFPGCLKNH